MPEDSEERQRIVAAAELLVQLLLQDVERTDDGVSRDRMMSVHDPEMRHGHKSSSRRFDGRKAAIVVDSDSQLITAVEVLPGNSPEPLTQESDDFCYQSWGKGVTNIAERKPGPF